MLGSAHFFLFPLFMQPGTPTHAVVLPIFWAGLIHSVHLQKHPGSHTQRWFLPMLWAFHNPFKLAIKFN